MAVLIGIILIVCVAVSVRWNWWRPRVSGIRILMYHKIGVPPAGSTLKKLWVSPAQFRRQLRYLSSRGYQVRALGSLMGDVAAGRPVPEKAVALTFDDGYRNNLEHALPLLRQLDFPATVFVVSTAIGGDNFWHDPRSETRISMLSGADITALQEAGIEIGSHTRTHVRLHTVDHTRAASEITDSKREIEAICGRPVRVFAYPYGAGAFQEDLQRLVTEAGYLCAVSVKRGIATPDSNRYALPRIFVRGDDTMWDFHLNLTRGKARL